MMKAFIEKVKKDFAYKKALANAEYEEKLLNVKEEAKIRNNLRLKRLKAQSINTNKAQNFVKSKVNTSKKEAFKIGNIMDLEY